MSISVKDLVVGEIYEFEGIKITDYFKINSFIRIIGVYREAARGYIWDGEDDDAAPEDEKIMVHINNNSGIYYDLGLGFILYEGDHKGDAEIHYFKSIKPYTDNILRAMKNAASDDT